MDESNFYTPEQNHLLDNSEVQKLVQTITDDYTFSLRELSHELGNIVTIINSSLQIIESSHPEVSSFKYWSSTINDVHYLMELLSKLSAFNNGSRLSISQFSAEDTISSVVNSFASNPNYSNTPINCTISGNLPLLSGDPVKLRQVLINLIKNAMEAECKNVNIQLSTQSSPDQTEQNYLYIDIIDDGVGLTPEQVSQIFKPMVTFKKNGSGLGLAICDRIIQAHHGTLSCTSELHKGTTFHIVLPCL